MRVNETESQMNAASQPSDQQTMHSEEIAISVKNLTKTYRIFGHPGNRIKQALTFGRMRFHSEFTALQDVSFEIKKGETVGIIGRNGSGKSTLLQLICGILKPTSGSVQVNGRISALLELGAGFNPEFTGRENVYFQGAVMGFTKAEMDARFHDIAAFADIGEFIDQPVRTYSSGMYVRLAFSVAVHVNPDILVVDEALAVGDTLFQRKCFDKIYEMQSRGISIIVVSHNPYQIERLCHKAVVLNKGAISSLRPAKEALNLYQGLVQQDLGPAAGTHTGFREGTHDLRFESVLIESADGTTLSIIQTGQMMSIVADVTSIRPVDDVRFRFEICSASNEIVTMVTTIGITENRRFDGRHRVVFHMSACQLTSGWYYINAVAVDRNLRLDTWQRATEFRVLLKDEQTLNLSSDNGAYVCQGAWEIN